MSAFLILTVSMVHTSTGYAKKLKEKKVSYQKEKRKKNNTNNFTLIQKFLAYAYIHSPDLDERRKNVMAVCQDIGKAKAGFLPTITTNYGINRDKTAFSSSVNSNQDMNGSKTTSRQAAIKLKQNLFRFGGNLAEYKAQEHKIIASFYEYYSAEQDFFVRLINSCLDTIYLKSNILHLEDSLNFTKQTLDQTNAKFVNGSETITQLKNAEGAYQKAHADLNTAKNDYQNAVNTMRSLSGGAVFDGVLGEWDDQIIDKFIPKDIEKAKNILKNHHPQCLKVKNVIEQAKKARFSTQTRYAPSIDLSAGIQRDETLGNRTISGDRGGFGNKTYGTNQLVGIQFSMPLYDPSLNSDLRRNGKDVVSAKASLQRVTTELLSALENAYCTMQSTKENIGYYMNAVSATKIALDATVSEYNAGLKAVIDVLNANQRLSESQLRSEDMKRQYQKAIFALYACIGKVNPTGLSLSIDPKDVFDPFAILQKVKNQF